MRPPRTGIVICGSGPAQFDRRLLRQEWLGVARRLLRVAPRACVSALLRKRGSVHATSLRGRPADQKAAIVAAVRQHVWPAVGDSRIRPVISDVLPLADAGRAHELMAAGQHVGKILLATD